MPTYQDLLRDVSQLAERFPGLGTRLSLAAGELKSLGTPPMATLIEELKGYQSEFVDLCHRALALAKEAGLPAAAMPVKLVSVRELEAFIQSLAPKDRVIAATGTPQERAIAVIDHLLRLTYTGDDQPFAPLVTCQQEAAKLQKVLQTTPGALSASANQAVEALAQGNHPVVHLLQLIDGAGNLDDDRWLALQESVTASLGRAMTAAALRGRLVAAAPTAIAPTPAAPGASSAPGLLSVPLEILVHVSGIGDLRFRSGDDAGTKGESRSLEGFQVTFASRVPGLGIRYMGHIQNQGDTPWVGEGEYVGTRGQNLRLEGFALELTGPEAHKYNLNYLGHFARFGDSSVVSNGEFCGIRGQAMVVEAMRVWVEPKR
ncbi:MAG: hypothetical protein Fur0042_26860 [Cyanophyceae cyanobacterium]